MTGANDNPMPTHQKLYQFFKDTVGDRRVIVDNAGEIYMPIKQDEITRMLVLAYKLGLEDAR